MRALERDARVELALMEYLRRPNRRADTYFANLAYKEAHWVELSLVLSETLRHRLRAQDLPRAATGHALTCLPISTAPDRREGYLLSTTHSVLWMRISVLPRAT